MHSDWFNGIEILQGRWQHGEKVGCCYPSGLEKTLCKWDIYVPLVTKGLRLIGAITLLPLYAFVAWTLKVFCTCCAERNILMGFEVLVAKAMKTQY